ncbi:hypothetical protein D3C80_2004970 [compost metagenome]
MREAIHDRTAASSRALRLTMIMVRESSTTGEVMLEIGEADTYSHSLAIREKSP